MVARQRTRSTESSASLESCYYVMRLSRTRRTESSACLEPRYFVMSLSRDPRDILLTRGRGRDSEWPSCLNRDETREIVDGARWSIPRGGRPPHSAICTHFRPFQAFGFLLLDKSSAISFHAVHSMSEKPTSTFPGFRRVSHQPSAVDDRAGKVAEGNGSLHPPEGGRSSRCPKVLVPRRFPRLQEEARVLYVILISHDARIIVQATARDSMSQTLLLIGPLARRATNTEHKFPQTEQKISRARSRNVARLRWYRPGWTNAANGET